MDVIYKLVRKNAKMPIYKTEGSAGADLCSAESTVIPAGGVKTVKTGLAVELPPGFEMQIRSRSGLSIERIKVANAPGTIDPDYRGEILVILENNSTADFKVKVGDRIAQCVIAAFVKCNFRKTGRLSVTKRGKKGFGSTGVSS